MKSTELNQPPWVTEYTPSLPFGLDLSRPFMSCEVLSDKNVNLDDARDGVRWNLVGYTSRRRRPSWWPFGSEWITTFYFQPDRT